MRLHHVGFVVADIASAMPGFLRSLGATWDSQVFTDPNQKVKVAFLTTRPGDALVELVEPDGNDSPVLRFLNEKGGGLHHACYEVHDVEQELSRLPQPRLVDRETAKAGSRVPGKTDRVGADAGEISGRAVGRRPLEAAALRSTSGAKALTYFQRRDAGLKASST